MPSTSKRSLKFRSSPTLAQRVNKLGFVDRQKALNGFDLDDDATIHYEIQTVAAVDQDLLICDGKMFLSTHNTGNFHTLIPRALVEIPVNFDAAAIIISVRSFHNPSSSP